jgi:predicted dehydrogenase
MLRLALVGVGHWGPNLLRNLASLEDARVVTVCDLDTERASAWTRQFCPGARVVGDYQALAEEPDLDAVVVATPIRTHAEIGGFLLKAGKHVLMEKPLARTVAECEDLIRLADLHERVLMVGHVFEYSVAVREAKRYIDRGELGDLLYVHSQRVNLGRVQTDVNALWSFAPHDVSILNYWLGAEPVRVSARGFSCLRRGVEDVVFVVLEYPSGVGAHLHLGWLDPRKVRLMTVVGSKKMLVYDDVSLDAKLQVYDKGVDGPAGAPRDFAEFNFQIRIGDLTVPTLQFAEPLRAECQHFVDCVQRNRRPLTDGASGLRVVRALEAAEASLGCEGRPVEVGPGPRAGV